MLCVDAWEVMPERTSPGAETYADWPLRQLEGQSRARLAEFENRATILKMMTSEAALQVPDGWLDFVFVDADHSYLGVWHDIVNWLVKIRAGGWITGHDIHRDPVKQAVEEDRKSVV